MSRVCEDETNHPMGGIVKLFSLDKDGKYRSGVLYMYINFTG